MRSSLRIIWLLQKEEPLAFWGGLFLAFLPAAAGIALLAVSGYFITATALAGLSAGAVAFNTSSAASSIRLYASMRIFGRYIERVITHDATFRFLANLRSGVFRGLVARESNGTLSQRSATALSRVVSDVDQLDGLFLRLVVPLASATIITGLTLVILWQYSPMASIALGAVQAAGLTILAKSGGHRQKAQARKLNAARDALRVRVSDLVRGRRDLSVFGGLEQQRVAALKAVNQLDDVQEQNELTDMRNQAVVSTMSQVMVAVTFLFAAYSYQQGQMELKHIALFAFVALALPELLISLANSAGSWSKMSGAADRVRSLLTVGQDSEALQNARSNSETPLFEVGKDALNLKDIHFAYTPKAAAILDGVDLALPTGSRTVVIGPSGAGKSTLAAIVARLQTPQSGAIQIGGVELGGMAEDKLRAALTVVGQRTQIFHSTIAENLRVAREDATDAELWEALSHAGLKELVEGRQEKLETHLGEGGLGLSGGEGRRLALARAYLRNPEIWVADELTEGLDHATADKVLASFRAMTRGKTVLMVSHRASELEGADRVLVLEDGKLGEVTLPLSDEIKGRLRDD
ncbi:thiol reductant ABC exporter subunit CydC [Pseudovibrio sp. WM33]|uniref:thiol reductant ABC exporter subunit CydC n=1 Tax=Pseudovibrio sp. WM33 TaxID=1735585 RepID=UPI0007AEDE99|nr:thiol reductant ABC exporter subunit CydC [Pseudovibrio sp. WM33]KZL18464.1 putative ABC transporter ATP-binding protein [Pseudovibrio sp. WM33]